jgi:Potential Queuosine, Q, salvage protein family
MAVTETIRTECARVASRARYVVVRDDLIPIYGASLLTGVEEAEATTRQLPLTTEERERRAAFWLTLDAINCGSGWFPTLEKPEGMSGYRTIAAGVEARFAERGPWSAQELLWITTDELAQTFGQDPEHELMLLFTHQLRDLGRHLIADYGGSFAKVGDRARGSAAALVETLAGWDCFADSSLYDDHIVPLLKRAQIAAADLRRADAVRPRFKDMFELTMFADNLVPHVLRLDGVLEFAPELNARIDAEELIDHGSTEEVEIRACAVHAVELLVRGMGRMRRGPAPTSATVDQVLWERGQGPAYKSFPRHRSRTSAY